MRPHFTLPLDLANIKITECRVPFPKSVWDKQIHGDRMWIGGCQGMGEEGMGGDCWQVWGFLLGWQDVLELDGGDGCIALWRYLKNWIVHLKLVMFTLYELYLDNNFLKTDSTINNTWRNLTQELWLSPEGGVTGGTGGLPRAGSCEQNLGGQGDGHGQRRGST